MNYKKMLVTICIVVLAVLGFMLLTSYAWYTFSGGWTVFNTNTYNEYIDIEYRNSAVINTTTAMPISDDEVDTQASYNNFYVDVVGGSNIAEVLLSISLVDISIDSNLQNVDFKYQLLHNGNVIKEGTGLDFTNTSFELTNKEVIYSDTVNDFSFRVWISDNGIKDSQNDMQNQTFSASIEVNAVKIRNEETNRVNIENATVTLSPNVYSYDGLAKEPSVSVKVGSTTLVKDTDYTVTYKNNINVGNSDSISPPTVIVTGIGNYVGIVRKTFTISRSGIIADVVDFSGDYDGNSHTISVNVITPSSGYTIRYGTTPGTYNLSTSPSYVNAGTYTIYYQISASGYDSLEGSSTVLINKKNISGCTVTLSSTNYTYDGTSKKPTVSVVCGSNTLTENTDYTVTYPTDTTSAGTKTVTIAGIGSNYTGSVTKNYTITDNGYTITLNVNGGSAWGSGSTCSGSDITSNGSSCTKSISTGAVIGSVPTPSRLGYTFSGWYSASSGGSQINVSSYIPTGDTTIYAHWTANTYNISYSLNNGLSGANAPVSATYNTNVVISNPTKSISIVGNANSTGASVGSNTSANYTFAGWTASNLNTSTAKYGTSSGSVTTGWGNGSNKVGAQYFKNLTSTANATVTLTANWTKPTTVTLPTLSKTGYTCNWYDNSSGTGTAYPSGGTYTLTSSDDGLTSKTFYASCVSNASSYTVTFDVNSGDDWTSSTCSTSDGFSLSGTTCSKTVSSDSTYGDLPTPVKSSSGSTYYATNYTFLGWYDASSGGNQIVSSSLSEITSDVTLYAQWFSYYSYSANSAITFDVNGGNVWTADTCKTGDGFVFNSSTSACTKKISSTAATTVNAFPIPTRDDYVFTGWYSATSGGSEYVLPYTTTRTNYTYASFTAYAQWEEGSSYTITYDANGGDDSSVPSPQTKEYGVNLTLSTTVPTRSGYTFLGWSTNSGAASATYQPGETYTSNASVTLYAVWQGPDVNVVSISIDGSSSDSLPTSGTYNMSYTCEKGSTLSWNTYSKTITYGAGSVVSDECSVSFTSSTNYPLLNTMEVGSYVAYTGSGGTVGSTSVACKMNGSASSSTGTDATEAPNSCIGQNAREDLNDTYGYCYAFSQVYYTTGWRIAYINNNKAIIISAGSPECNKITASSKNETYIKTANAKALKYCNINYVDGNCTCADSDGDRLCDSPSTDAWAINDTDFYYITKAISGVGKRLSVGSSSLGDSGGTLQRLYCWRRYSYQECGYNNDLIDNGGHYWFAAREDSLSSKALYWHSDGFVDAKVPENYTYGLRPVISLSSTVYVTGGAGTIDDPYTIAN